MRITSSYPVLMSDDVAATAAFCREHLGLVDAAGSDAGHTTGASAAADVAPSALGESARGRAAPHPSASGASVG